MDVFLIIFVIFQAVVINWKVNPEYDIRKYFDKSYCEQVTLGKEEVKKCWTVKEIK
jgi:hypothetical protein